MINIEDFEDIILQDIDFLRERDPDFLNWYLDTYKEYIDNMNDEELEAWADRQEQRANEYFKNHPEEEAELCKEERFQRIWRNIQKELNL